MSNPRFDPSKDHGTISPFWHGAQYHQNGCYYSPQGDFLFRDGDDPSAVSTAAGASAPATTETATQTKAPTSSGSTAPVDLAAWARGEQSVPFFAVKKVFAAAFPDVKVRSAADIKAALKDAGMV